MPGPVNSDMVLTCAAPLRTLAGQTAGASPSVWGPRPRISDSIDDEPLFHGGACQGRDGHGQRDDHAIRVGHGREGWRIRGRGGARRPFP